MKKCKLRKDDLVEVISGNDRGKRGRILEVYPRRDQVLVEGVNYHTHHERVRQDKGGQSGGIEEREAPLHISNVMIVDPKTNQAARIGVKEEEGVRVRFTKGRNASGAVLDQ